LGLAPVRAAQPNGAVAAPAIDLSPCAEEPIHIPGTIAPHGALLVLSEPGLIVTHVSDNIERILGTPLAAACGAHASKLLGEPQCTRLAAALLSDDLTAVNPSAFMVERAGVKTDIECTVHRSGRALIVELEPYTPLEERTPVDLYAQIRAPIARMEQAADLLALARGAAADIQALTGFDRAMIYRFDEDWNGEIIAESTRPGLAAAYVGLNFPATDIPEQARRLYVKNPLRLIPDVECVPSRLLSEPGAVNGAPIDLTYAILRSVSPYHIEYLHNMGVRATLTISIVILGKLWGLVACHNLEPRRLDFGMRAICELLGNMLSSQIGKRLEVAALREQLRANALLASYSIGLRANGDLMPGIFAGAADLLELFGAQGLLVRIDGSSRRVGATPPGDGVVAKIAAALAAEADGGVAANSRLAPALPESDAAATACGALFIALSEAADEYVLCFRDEAIAHVKWGGDPRGGVTLEAGKLHPRASFAIWRETMRGRSLPWSPENLLAARSVRQRILERRQTTERRRAEERIRYLAYHDTLTQLPNRASFHESLHRSIGEATHDGTILALLFIDLDRLKSINEAFGLAMGDRLLQAAATRIRACIRHDDVVARLGGDEYGIILANLKDEKTAEIIAAKLLAAIAAPFLVPGTPEFHFTASVGIAIFPADAGDGETLLRHADLAMYRAKQQGRNEFARFGAGDAPPTYERLAFSQRLQLGLEQHEFVAYYQPIVSLATGRIVALEALARWIHPDLGVLPPARFIALAEESRSIVNLGEVMLRSACAQAARWRGRPGFEALRVSVNISARQFREDGFLGAVQETLTQSGLAADGLQLELTESMLIGGEPYAMRTLRALADGGISVAIDDFGTGYSSLSYLKRLPVDCLKIDQSFVRDVTLQAGDSAIVRAIIAMAHSLKLDVIAEGVETIEQLNFLRAEGCDFIQGFFVAQPLAQSDATAFIDRFDPKVAGTAPPASGPAVS
jgi:diguanylate cyclase (GGDEF)-like protein